MQVERSAPRTKRTVEIGRVVLDQNGPCVGCTECRGICLALAEAATLPDLLLRRGANT